ALPAVIGNLNGVPYWARDQANRSAAQRAYARAEDALRTARDRYAKSVGTAAQRAAGHALGDALERRDQLKNFLAASRTSLNGVDGMARQVVSFDDGQPPLGAVSIGDLDSAD
ncbi:unnamed protein product, partial [marine sediment metagenome]